MNRAKEHRTRPKSPPCSDGLFVARRAAGALRLIPPSSLVAHLQTIKRSEVSARRRLSTPPVPHFLRSSPSRARTKPQMPPVRSSSALPLRIHTEHSRFVHRQGQGAVALPHGRARLTSAPPPHRIHILLAVLFPSSHCPSSLSPALPVFSPPDPVSGHKKSTSNDVLFYSFGQMRLWSALAAAHRRSMGVSGSKGDRKAAGAEDSGMTHRLKAEPPLQQKLQSLHTLLSPQVQERLYAFNRIQLQTA